MCAFFSDFNIKSINMSSLMDEDGYIYDVDEFTENDLELIVMTKDELSMSN